MVEDAYVNDIPVMTGGVGKPALREFYSKYFITKMPPDIELMPISRTIGTDQLVDEMLVKFTHNVHLDWMLPGITPTGKRVEAAVVGIVQFRDSKLAHEHIYWDQASVLVQLGLLDPGKLPVVGVDSRGYSSRFEEQERVPLASGSNYGRLLNLKRKYDPDDVIRSMIGHLSP
jgi:carboxymethylenebutenolidase